MARVRLDHHRTSRRQRRGRVTPESGEREREIAGSHHDHGTDRDQHAAQIGPWDWLAIRLRVVDAGIHPRAFANQSRKRFELSAGASPLASETIEREAGFHMRPLQKVIADAEAFATNYANPLYRMPLTFIELFPVGVLITLISAAVLRNSRVLPARRA